MLISSSSSESQLGIGSVFNASEKPDFSPPPSVRDRRRSEGNHELGAAYAVCPS